MKAYIELELDDDFDLTCDNCPLYIKEPDTTYDDDGYIEVDFGAEYCVMRLEDGECPLNFVLE